MWKHKNFINLQLHAPSIGWGLTITFDTNAISKIIVVSPDYPADETAIAEWTTNSGERGVVYAQSGATLTGTITLKDGYIFDAITGATKTSDTTFTLIPMTSETALTITTKAAAFDGSISLTNPSGVILKTQGKYCDKDITITPVLEEKTVTPSTTQQSVEPSDGNVGLKKVTVAAVQTETKTVTPSTSSQTVTPTSGKFLASVTVQAVPQETKTVTPTASAQNVTPSSGKFLSRVTVSAVPSESKTVTPTKSTQTITPSSGKWLSSVTVNAIPDDYIIPSGTQQVTENGTYDVTDKASVVVDVPAVTDVATSTEMDALLVEANVGKYYKFTGTTDSNYTNGDLYLVEGGGGVSSHYLTWTNDSIYVTVNGSAVSSPYTLQNGDVIIVKETTGENLNALVTVGSTTYDTDSTPSPLEVSNSDISLELGTYSPSPSLFWGFTINYTA